MQFAAGKSSPIPWRTGVRRCRTCTIHAAGKSSPVLWRTGVRRCGAFPAAAISANILIS
jgi:hypothetical protein